MTEQSEKRTGHDQEEDTTYSPRGWRDKEYRNYVDMRMNAVILMAIGGMTAVVSLLSVAGRSLSLESAGLVLLAVIGMLMAFLGVMFWEIGMPYPRTRRLGK